MYPLDVKLPAPLIGFAVANDEAEHLALTAAGYVPALVVTVPEVVTVPDEAPPPKAEKPAK